MWTITDTQYLASRGFDVLVFHNDYYCGKHVLMPVSGDPRHNPDGSNTFRQMLLSSSSVLSAGGKQVKGPAVAGTRLLPATASAALRETGLQSRLCAARSASGPHA